MSKSIFLFDNISCRCLNCGNYYSIPTKGVYLSTMQLPHTQEEIPIQFLAWYLKIDFKNTNGYLGTLAVKCPRCDDVNSVAIIFQPNIYNYNNFDFLCTSVLTHNCEPTKEIKFSLVLDENDNIGSFIFNTIPYSQEKTIDEILSSVLSNYDNVYNLTPDEFEELIAHVFRFNGFKTTLTKKSHDGDVDIYATKNTAAGPVMFIIQCKRYNNRNNVGVKHVREIYGVFNHIKNVNKCIVVTSGKFTAEAHKFANDVDYLVHLIDKDKLQDLLFNLNNPHCI